MLDELKEEEIVNKVGGRFKLSTLIQKRMVALNTGAKPLVDVRTGDKMAIVLLEILEGHAPARVDKGVIQDRVAQHRLDHDLAHPHGGLARLGPVVAGQDLGALLDHAGIAEAMQLTVA